MSDIHIDDFYRDAAKILIALYSQFPRKIVLYVEDIAGPDTPDEFGLHSKRHEACLHTMLWLGNNGYLQFDDIVKQEAIDQAVLTQKAFLLLNSFFPNISTSTHDEELPPEVVHRDLLCINVLRREIKLGTSFSINQHMHSLFSMRPEH